MTTDLLLNDFAIRSFRDEEDADQILCSYGVPSGNTCIALGQPTDDGEVLKMHSPAEPHSG
jgi:hypothetical protein